MLYVTDFSSVDEENNYILRRKNASLNLIYHYTQEMASRKRHPVTKL